MKKTYKCHSEGIFVCAGTKKDAYHFVTAAQQHDIINENVPNISIFLSRTHIK